jgi:hypothetical protein
MPAGGTPVMSQFIAMESLESRCLYSVSLSVGSNVNISRSRDSEAEGAVSVDPTNPNRVFTLSNRAEGGLFSSYSTDGGKSWHKKVLADGPGALPEACCDPSTSFDQFGNLFICYLDEDHGVNVALSTDGGKNFKFLKKVTSDEVDQPTLVTGPSNLKGKGSVWVSFSRDGEEMVVSGATVNGKASIGSFSSPRTINGAQGNFGDIVVGPSGQVMVGWQDNTTDEGPTNIYEAVDPDGLGAKPFGSRVKITRGNVGGFDLIPAQPHRSIDAELGFAWDRTSGKHAGRLYAIYTDEIRDESNNTDIFLRRSDDGGKSWSSPKRVNDDTGTSSQFLPRIAIDQTTGNVAMSWYDCRNDTTKTPKNDEAAIYAAVTVDGGFSITKNIRVSVGASKASRIGDDFDFGDYTGLAFQSGWFYPVWADNSYSLGNNPGLPVPDLAIARIALKLS